MERHYTLKYFQEISVRRSLDESAVRRWREGLIERITTSPDDISMDLVICLRALEATLGYLGSDNQYRHILEQEEDNENRAKALRDTA